MTTDLIDPRSMARLDVTMGIEILEASSDRVVATMGA